MRGKIRSRTELLQEKKQYGQNKKPVHENKKGKTRRNEGRHKKAIERLRKVGSSRGQGETARKRQGNMETTSDRRTRGNKQLFRVS